MVVMNSIVQKLILYDMLSIFSIQIFAMENQKLCSICRANRSTRVEANSTFEIIKMKLG